MNGEALARFMELRGWKVVQGAGSFWQQFRERCYISFPLHVTLDPNPDELDAMLRATGALCFRYSAANSHGLTGGLYVVRDKNFGLTSVHAKVRAKLRRGLERCEIRPVDIDGLAAEGLQLNLETMARQKRFEREFGEPKRWKRFLEAVRRSPSVAAMGAFLDGRLNSYMILQREDGWMHLLYQMTLTSGFEHGANTALHYEVCRMIADPELDAICSGPLPLAQDRMRHFKLHMGMTVLPQTFAFRFHPAVSRLFSGSAAQGVADGLQRLWPGNARLEVLGHVIQGAQLSNCTVRPAKEVVSC